MRPGRQDGRTAGRHDGTTARRRDGTTAGVSDGWAAGRLDGWFEGRSPPQAARISTSEAKRAFIIGSSTVTAGRQLDFMHR